ncbi:Alpha-fimbriae tip adhesin [Enterobacter hormaechei]|uniref:CfaE/CblD family pilus tip adhesin n=1 Tax=Enterobacter hormaechei TaxID=158836 RepID=UPI0007946D09|nr:CfaE/CblD family pilus tip adhesin [Enterobacter hormaechei]SAG82475.1 Alpha-fimbriae tip adhesin [Enterobacter hormaechei]
MKINIYCWLTALCCLVSLPGLAELPTSSTTTVTKTMDTSSLPSTLYIWNEVTVGSRSGVSSENVSMVCKSSSDSTNGACKTYPVWIDGSSGAGSITLVFTQERTGATKVLTVKGTRYNGSSTGRQPWTGVSSAARIAPKFTYAIAQSELSSLTDGVWRATLMMDYYTYTIADVVTKLSTTWTADITLTVTTDRAQQVYFPAFTSTDATIDLRIRSFFSKSASGSASLDMCLYDGANAAGKTIILSLSDARGSPSDRTSGLFSVYRTGGSVADAADRIDFAISVTNPVTNAAQTLKNGESITWTAPDGGFKGRLVTLPNYTTSVYCVPAPLTFTTPTFKPLAKHSGDYTGTVTVTYTPSTS